MSEEITWSLVRDLRADDVVRLNYAATSHYFGIDTKPEVTGTVQGPFGGDMPEVEFWQTEMDREMNVTGESELQKVNSNCRVQVLVPRPGAGA
jgi:hypothetical protein